GWGEGGLGVSDGTLVFCKRLIKANSRSVPRTGTSPAAHCGDQNTLCTKSRFSPATLAGSHVALHPLSCHEDTSQPFIHSCFLGWFFCLATEGKEEEGKKENNPSRVPQGKPGERSSALYSAGQFFFEYLVVVSLKVTDGRYEPKITYQFPKRENLLKGQKEEEERLLKAIPLFCFPDGNNWAPVTEFTSETFSFVLTNVDGSRKIGYCRRLLPSGRGVRLPEVFCIISCLGCFGLFSKILDEVEKRRQISMAVIYPFMQGLRESPFPAPGKTVTIKSFIPESGTELIELTRPVDAHLEHVEFQALLQRLSPHLILHIFASAVLERRLIFLAEELSVLSQCIHAVAALLYPFTWAHTYIPVVPECLLDTVCCPTPFMVGIQMRHLERVLDQPMEEALMVDLCKGKILRAVGDEEEILPIKLQNEMLASLNRHNNNNNVHSKDNSLYTVKRTQAAFRRWPESSAKQFA
uniref:DENN domain containing 2D n=1 Tax=Calidris pygmaea TaxID=425635 RepID=A0A8C3K1W1_9CHAR